VRDTDGGGGKVERVSGISRKGVRNIEGGRGIPEGVLEPLWD